MSIITISRDVYSKGKEISENVSSTLMYECLSREVLLEASKEFNVPEIKLNHAIKDAPSILERMGYQKEKYITFIWSAILKHFRKDDVVYCGLAGHFFVKDIPHVLKVRIIVNLDERVKNVAEREGISRKEALRKIRQDDEGRRKWSQHLYGIDIQDPSLYDLVIHLGNMTPDDAADVICKTVARKTFETTPESQQALEDIAIATQVKAALMDLRPDVDVVAAKGVVKIHTTAVLVEGKDLIRDMEAIAKSVDGVKEVYVGAKHREDYVS